MSDPIHRLTKKERKAQAHKQRGKTRKALSDALDLDANGLPQMDEEEDLPVNNILIPTTPSKSTKRKRDEVDNTPSTAVEQDTKEAEAKKPKLLGGDEAAAPSPPTSKPVKKRYVLFVGNLSYNTTPESIAQYLNVLPSLSESKPNAKRPKPPAVRMLTKGPGDATSKGCAFVEFEGPGSLQRALKMDNTEFEGRKLRVELTVGGGGTKETRTQKLKTKNKKLRDKRTAANNSETYTPPAPRNGQRHDRNRRPTGSTNLGQNNAGSRRPDRSVTYNYASTGANAITATRKWGTK